MRSFTSPPALGVAQAEMQVLRRQAIEPTTLLPYHRVGPRDWWVSDVDSPRYNTRQVCDRDACPFDTNVSEQLGAIMPEYEYAVVIDYNTAARIPGAGSTFFLHVSAGVPTQGCVALSRDDILALMRWLDPTRMPVMAIGANEVNALFITTKALALGR
ncbi:hypothetical protein EH165_12200 [Nakamurella antarctica]|uniref:L,D-peptidoglycan transpeptidase YkuD, ErfK/YbiS/YcfS/YnhG family n=1 Tax=Nakamurella antarctica TaxID=1902245 RepID=A0A3G8ZN71_9ACTN|nr:L,D-transpeptidase family protein [Nakamurella antarctica]AZI58782.1 hypothetical protein EH165_12200 [Nakamurella antarctica]